MSRSLDLNPLPQHLPHERSRVATIARIPFHEIEPCRGRKARDELLSGRERRIGDIDAVKCVPASSIERNATTWSNDSTSARAMALSMSGVASRAPLLEQPARFQPHLEQIVELRRIQEARARGLERRRRVDGDDIELVAAAMQETAAVVDDDAAFGVFHQRRAHRRSSTGKASGTLRARSTAVVSTSPRQRRAIGRAHAEADDDHRVGAAVKGERHVRHQLGQRRQRRDADAVDEQVLAAGLRRTTQPSRCDRGESRRELRAVRLRS